MPSLSELRAELKELRKSSLGERPVSRMTKGDISAQIEHLKRMRGETPAAAAVPSAPLRKSVSAVESVKEAKASEFPIMPAHAKSVVPKKAPAAPKKVAAAAAAPAKKSSKMDRLMRMLEEMSDDE